MASCALDLGLDVWGVIETHMRFFEKSIDPLPRHVFATLRMVSQRLNARIGRIAEVFMAKHARVDARDPGARAARHSGMALWTPDADFIDGMDLVRKVDRLLRLGPDV